jgi:hypothetical protein
VNVAPSAGGISAQFNRTEFNRTEFNRVPSLTEEPNLTETKI